MERISIKHLESMINRLNRITDSPETPYSKDDNGKFHANIGNWHLSQAYGGVEVNRMSNENGGVTTPIWHGHVPKREAADMLRAFINGVGTQS